MVLVCLLKTGRGRKKTISSINELFKKVGVQIKKTDLKHLKIGTHGLQSFREDLSSEMLRPENNSSI